MNTPRFLIAKYVPDLQRMEPRNVGVILWADGSVAARFIGEDENTLEIKRWPDFIKVRNRPVYQDWLTFWREIISAESVSTRQGKVERMSEKFVDGLRATGRENFILVDGGLLFTEIDDENLSRATDELFKQLVDDSEPRHTDNAEKLDHGWKRVVARSGLKRSPKFHPNGSIKGKFHQIERDYKFTAVIGNGEPEAALQKVSVGNNLSVNNASWMFDGLLKNNWRKDRCIVFYYSGAEEEVGAAEVQLNIAQLKEVSTAINVVHPRAAVREFKDLGIDLSSGH
jgi:hypothetical protein